MLKKETTFLDYPLFVHLLLQQITRLLIMIKIHTLYIHVIKLHMNFVRVLPYLFNQTF
jgi:hypothetical protein